MDQWKFSEEAGLTQQLLDAGLAPNFGHFPLQGLLVVGRQGEDFEGQRASLSPGDGRDGRTRSRPFPTMTSPPPWRKEVSCVMSHTVMEGVGWGRAGSAGCDGRRGSLSPLAPNTRLAWCSCSRIFDCIGSALWNVMKNTLNMSIIISYCNIQTSIN